MSTTMVKKDEVVRKWYVIDAAGKPLGKTAALAADLLRGKLKVDYTPHVDCGDYVIEIKSRAFIQACACQKDFSSFLVLRVSFTLFNLQGARRFACGDVYSITRFPACQEKFFIFQKFFSFVPAASRQL